jgi:hypothetical protein
MEFNSTDFDFNGQADFSGRVMSASFGAFQGTYATSLTGPHVFIDAASGTPRIGGLTTSGSIQPLQIRSSTITILDASVTMASKPASSSRVPPSRQTATS